MSVSLYVSHGFHSLTSNFNKIIGRFSIHINISEKMSQLKIWIKDISENIKHNINEVFILEKRIINKVEQKQITVQAEQLNGQLHLSDSEQTVFNLFKKASKNGKYPFNRTTINMECINRKIKPTTDFWQALQDKGVMY